MLALIVFAVGIVLGFGLPLLALLELVTYRERCWLETAVRLVLYVLGTGFAWWWLLCGAALNGALP